MSVFIKDPCYFGIHMLPLIFRNSHMCVRVCFTQRVQVLRRPKDHLNTRIIHSGIEVQGKGVPNHGLYKVVRCLIWFLGLCGFQSGIQLWISLQRCISGLCCIDKREDLHDVPSPCPQRLQMSQSRSQPYTLGRMQKGWSYIGDTVAYELISKNEAVNPLPSGEAPTSPSQQDSWTCTPPK